MNVIQTFCIYHVYWKVHRQMFSLTLSLLAENDGRYHRCLSFPLSQSPVLPYISSYILLHIRVFPEFQGHSKSPVVIFAPVCKLLFYPTYFMTWTLGNNNFVGLTL